MDLKRITLTMLLLVIAAPACNMPSTQPTVAPPPTVTPFVPPQEETSVPPAQPSEEPATPVPPTQSPATSPSPTASPSPTPTSSPQPTIAPPPVSAGPLNFPEPTRLDGYQPLSGGQYEVTIVVHITGGAPPFTVHHDLDTFETWLRDYPLIFQHAGCSAIVHTITVESADGQSVSHDYWIPAPWCATPEP